MHISFGTIFEDGGPVSHKVHLDKSGISVFAMPDLGAMNKKKQDKPTVFFAGARAVSLKSDRIKCFLPKEGKSTVCVPMFDGIKIISVANTQNKTGSDIMFVALDDGLVIAAKLGVEFAGPNNTKSAWLKKDICDQVGGVDIINDIAEKSGFWNKVKFINEAV